MKDIKENNIKDFRTVLKEIEERINSGESIDSIKDEHKLVGSPMDIFYGHDKRK